VKPAAAPPEQPPKQAPLPYGRQEIGDDDIAAVVAVLRSDWLTTGPKVDEFEAAFARFVGAPEAVAVSSGTAALHAATFALGVGPGDEVIVPALTFAATANAVVYQGGTPVFADVDAATLLLDLEAAEALVTPRTRAVVAVDYAGQPCDADALRALCERRGLALVADACHALGAADRGRPVGTLADLTAFSFHPVKPITTAEGGMVTTADPALARRMRVFRNHGITTDHRQRTERGAWFYEMEELGYNYRLSDLHSALGLSQLAKLPAWAERRRAIAARYDAAFAALPGVTPLALRPEVEHAYHLYVVRLALPGRPDLRQEAFAALRAAGVLANVHYVPVHLHPYYRRRFGTAPGLCPRAEAAYGEILTLPIFPAMSDDDVDRVVAVLSRVVEGGR
jgi:UDP-4-amino-4,6-dideoxy-N-acetyl-beta-L-altrosamine transaminase